MSETAYLETNPAVPVSAGAHEETQGGCVRVTRRDNRFFALHWPERAAPSLPPAAALDFPMRFEG